MEFFQKIKRKIKEGFLKELARETAWMWQYVRRYRTTVLTHILLGLVGILMGLGTSVASKYLIDAVTGHRSSAIGDAVVLMAAMLLGSIAMKSAVSRIGALINIRVQNEIQAEVYQHVLATDWESLEQYRSGDLLHRLTGDVNTVAGGVTGFVPSLIAGMAQFFGALAIMLWFDPTMALIALMGIPVAVLSSKMLMGKMRTHSKKMKSMSSDMMAFYETSVSNLTSIKSFDITEDFFDRMLQIQNRYREEYLTYNRFSVHTSACISLVGMLVSAGCFGWGVYRLWSGAISFGSMTMFLQLASTLSGAFSGLIGLMSTAISVSTSAGRVMEVIQMPSEETPEDRDYRDETELSIRMEHAGFAYQNGEQVLNNVNFEAGSGDLVALTGPSGEGKTTMLRMILGLIQPQSGRAVLCCKDGRTPLSAATRSAFSYVPQGNSMFAGTIEENLRLTRPDATKQEMEQVLKIACAYDFVKEMPGQLKHLVGSRGSGLSEGQAQRLAVARALLRGAPILLLDEATSALDLATEEKLLENLMTCGLVHTCIFVTHRPGAAQFCARRYHVEDGRVTLSPQEKT